MPSIINGWLKALKGDKKCIFSAASQAQKAIDYLTQGQELAAEQGAGL